MGLRDAREAAFPQASASRTATSTSSTSRAAISITMNELKHQTTQATDQETTFEREKEAEVKDSEVLQEALPSVIMAAFASEDTVENIAIIAQPLIDDSPEQFHTMSASVDDIKVSAAEAQRKIGDEPEQTNSHFQGANAANRFVTSRALPVCVLIRNIPKTGEAKYSLLRRVLAKVITRSSAAHEELYHPFDEESGETSGMCIIRYKSNTDAEHAVSVLDGFRLDAQHTLEASTTDASARSMDQLPTPFVEWLLRNDIAAFDNDEQGHAASKTTPAELSAEGNEKRMRRRRSRSRLPSAQESEFEHQILAQQVRQLQHRDTSAHHEADQTRWHSFCRTCEHSTNFDPARHSAATLRRFLGSVETGRALPSSDVRPIRRGRTPGRVDAATHYRIASSSGRTMDSGRASSAGGASWAPSLRHMREGMNS